MRRCLLLLCLACACGDDHAVPFKRASSVPADSKPSPTPPEVTPDVGTRGQSFPAGTHEAELSGAKLELAPLVLRAALEADLDPETASEWLLVVQDAEGKPQLARTQRLERGWAVPSIVAALELGAGCELVQAELVALGPSYATVAAELACTPPTAAAAAGSPPTNPVASPQTAAQTPAAPAPAPAAAPAPPPSATDRALWLATLERAPRVLEHFRVPLAGEPKLTASLHERDLDADGHPDMLLALEVSPANLPMTRVEAHFLNRAGGLAQKPGEPETALLALADDAKAERKKNPATAMELAKRVLAVHRALCHESGGARLVLGTAAGLPCGASLAAGRAASVSAAVLASRNELAAALDQYASLSGPAYRLTENDWDRARSAIMAKAEAGSLEWKAGPKVQAPSGTLLRRSAIAFIDEQQLLLRGPTARTYDLATGALAATGLVSDTRVVDPTGQLAISAIVRSCQGYHLQIVQTAQLVAGVLVGPAIAEPLIAAADPPAGAACPELDPEARKDTGGHQVIDWTPQGVLLARRESLLLLRLDASGRAAVPAEPLPAAAAAAPAQGHSVQLTADGRHFAFATSLGIALLDRSSGRLRLLALPGGPTAGLPVADLAISPSARRLALVRGGELWVGSPPEPPAPAPAP